MFCRVLCIESANSTKRAKCFHRVSISSSSCKTNSTGSAWETTVRSFLFELYLGLLCDIESTGSHIRRADRFDLGHVGELALIEELPSSKDAWNSIATGRKRWKATVGTYRIEIGDDFVEETQTFESLVVDRFFWIEFCERKEEKKKKTIKIVISSISSACRLDDLRTQNEEFTRTQNRSLARQCAHDRRDQHFLPEKLGMEANRTPTLV